MLATTPLTIAGVGVIIFVGVAIAANYLPSRLDSLHWIGFKRDGGFTRKQLGAARDAIRRRKFTTEDPIIREIMLERARYLSSSGVSFLIQGIVLFTSVGLMLTLLYLFTATTVIAIVIQSLLLLFIATSIRANVLAIRNARKFLAPWSGIQRAASAPS